MHARAVALALIAASLAGTAALAKKLPVLAPPVAKKVPHAYTVAGQALVDDYAWLKDVNDPDRLAYLQAENAYAQQQLRPTAPLADVLYKEMLARIQETDEEVPWR